MEVASVMEDPVTQRQVNDLKELLQAQFRALENRLTLKIVVAMVAASAVGKAIGPSTVETLAALGVAGWLAKTVIVFLTHR